MATKKATAKTTGTEKPAKATKAVKTATVAVTEPNAVVETPEVAVKPTAKKTAAKKSDNSVIVTFSLPKAAVENAETVAVLGDFNNWQGGAILEKQKDGSFATAIALEKGRSYEFRFLIDGQKWENAWNADAYTPAPFGEFNSVVSL